MSRWSMVVLPDSSGSSCGTALLAPGGPTLLVSQVLTLTCQQRLLLKILEPPAAPRPAQVPLGPLVQSSWTAQSLLQVLQYAMWGAVLQAANAGRPAVQGGTRMPEGQNPGDAAQPR